MRIWVLSACGEVCKRWETKCTTPTCSVDSRGRRTCVGKWNYWSYIFLHYATWEYNWGVCKIIQMLTKNLIVQPQTYELGCVIPAYNLPLAWKQGGGESSRNQAFTCVFKCTFPCSYDQMYRVKFGWFIDYIPTTSNESAAWGSPISLSNAARDALPLIWSVTSCSNFSSLCRCTCAPWFLWGISSFPSQLIWSFHPPPSVRQMKQLAIRSIR